MSTAMICFASEQVWPNLQAIIHWMRHEHGLSHLFIYHTDDEQFSKAPANRLAAFIKKLFPRLAVHTGGADMSPAHIADHVRSWIHTLPHGSNIVFNITCGTKLMTCGGVYFAGHPGFRLIYREREGQWYTVSRLSDDSPLSLAPFSIPASCTDHISPLDLLELQGHVHQELRWHADEVVSLPVLDVTKHFLTCNWDLHRVSRRYGVNGSQQPGYFFEHYIASLVKAFGISSALMNVRLLPDKGNPLDEIDVLANSSGRLLFIECKWAHNNTEPLVSQLERAAQRRRTFGGLAAHFLVIRPLKELSRSHAQLANLIGVTVIDRNSMSSLISTLARLLQRTITPELAQIEHLFRTHTIPSPANFAKKRSV